MLVIFLILFTNVLADTDDDKYVDLLPDAEKQLFIEKVARRILKDVESQENATTAESGELSDEQLKKHKEYVKSVLKEEADHIRRSKGEPIKEGEKKSSEKSDEKESLGVKPLETEKIALPDDPDIEQVDLTLRNDRRGGFGGSDDSTSDYIKVEIVTDNAPIIKRSVQNDNGNSDSESEELTSEILERVNSKTDDTNQVKTTITEKPKNVNSTSENIKATTAESKLVETTTAGSEHTESTTAGSEHTESTTAGSEHTESKSESPEKVQPIFETIEHRETKNNESKVVETKIKDTELTAPTTTGIKNKESEEEEDSKSNNSSENDEESVQVKSLEKSKPRKSKVGSNDSTRKTTESKPNGMEYFGVKLTENKSDDYNSVASGDIEEFTTITSPVDSTTMDGVPTTQNMDEVTELFTTTTYTTTQKDDSNTKKDNIIITDSSTKSTLSSTLTDEGTTDLVKDTTTDLVTEMTTDLVTETTAYKSSTVMMRTQEEISTAPSTAESTLRPVAITEEMKIIVEDFTSAPVKTNIGRTTKDKSNNESKAIKQPATIASKEITTRKQDVNNKPIEAITNTIKFKPTVHRYEKTITGPKKKRDDAKAKELKEKQLKDGITYIGTDKNFIELEKKYYNNNYKVKTGEEYRVYEIPADKSPFLPEEQFMTDQPYYVPIYNYSPNNAYFNPINRLGPNPEDASNEEVGAFTIADDLNDVNSHRPLNENAEAQNYDMEYSDKAFDSKRKRFDKKQKLKHSIYKMPHQNNSQDYYYDTIDDDISYGRVGKDLERRLNHINFDFVPNSNEGEHPAHSIQEMSLKDHVRAVRNILFQQKFFGAVDPQRQGMESEIYKRNKQRGERLSKASQLTSILTQNDKKDSKNDNQFQRVGYLTNQNNTKELYVMDQFFKDSVAKYIHEIKTKDNTYIKADLTPATPLPMSKNDIQKDKLITKFQGEENKRNEEIEKNLQKNNTSRKIARMANKKDKVETPKKNENKVVKKNNNEKNTTAKKGEINAKDNKNSTKQELNLRMNRRNDAVKIGVYLQVLRDMISLDNKALQQYDWLGTTVDIQASLQKLFELTSLVVNEEDIHPADMEILKYVLFQQKLAVEIIEANDFGAQLRKKLIKKKLALPRNKKKKVKPNMLKEKGLINRVWLYLRREVPEVNENGSLKNLIKFLIDIEDGLFDLHDAIKNVAKITKYKNQHWYQNLKEIYLDTDDKHLLELLLHMTVSRLFGLIEESAKNGLEDDYIQYMKKNKKEAKRTLEEVLFAIQIMDEIKKL